MLNYPRLFQIIHHLHAKIPYTFLNGYALPPVHIFFMITSDCNLKCSMCYVMMNKEKYLKQDSYQEYYKELDFYEVKKILKSLPRYSLMTFSGGELFTREDFMGILEIATKLNRCSIITNGTLITEEIAEALIEMGSRSLFHKGLIEIGVSLEGTEKIHDNITGLRGSYTRTIEGIKNILRYRKIKNTTFPLVTLRIVIMNSNVDVLPQFLSLAEDLNIDICNFNIEEILKYFDPNISVNEKVFKDSMQLVNMINSEVLEEKLNEINSMIRKTKVKIRFTPSFMPISEIIKYYRNELDLSHYICYMPWSRLTILPNGEVALCANCRIGRLNLRDCSINKLWNSQQFKNFRRTLKKRKIFGFCEGCSDLEFKRKFSIF